MMQMRKLLARTILLCIFLIICGKSVTYAADRTNALNPVAVDLAQESAFSKGLGERPSPLVVKVESLPDDRREVWLSVLMFIVAIFQAAMFWWQLQLMKVANRAAVVALNAANPPKVRITNPQIWQGGSQPHERAKGAVLIEGPGEFHLRVHAINEGGGAAHVDVQPDVDGNVCIAWISDRDDGLLPMFRPYKYESNARVEKFPLKKNVSAAANPKPQDWVDRNLSNDGYLTLQPGEFGRWDLNFSLSESDSGNSERSLYLMGIVVYWCLSDKKERTRRRATGFAYKFDQGKQVFEPLSSEKYPDYVFDE